VIAVVCRDCVLRSCALGKGLTHCAQCSNFPCQELVDFSNDGLPHHSEVLDNVRRVRDVGIEAWMAEQEKRWRCPNCGDAIDWYATQCAGCSASLSISFSAPENLV